MITAFERAKTVHALERLSTVTGKFNYSVRNKEGSIQIYVHLVPINDESYNSEIYIATRHKHIYFMVVPFHTFIIHNLQNRNKYIYMFNK
jgi:hypothetical protein